MTPEDRLRELFERAADLDIEERERFLERECANDGNTFIQELRRLLAAHDAALGNRAWDISALENEAAREQIAPQTGAGEIVGNFRLTELIGTGGMGSVYRAVRADSEYQQSVAVKRIRPGFDAEQIVSRFRSERQILATLEHPNIARLLDGGTDRNGLPYLVMEFVDGAAPLAYCDAHGLAIPGRLSLFCGICAAVQYAHQRMVIHRDLKPGNILVTADGTPKLLDFGIAKVLAPDSAACLAAATETASHMMTARYSSPEQVRGEPITTGSDVYSLGVILYELLTGHSPYRDPGRPAHELMRAVCEEDPVTPSVRRRELQGDLDTIILKALKKDPRERYPTVDRFSDDIQRYLHNRPITARADSFSYVTQKFIRRHKVGSVAAAIMVAAIVVSFVMIGRAQARAERRFNQVRELAHAVMFDYHDAVEPLPGSTPVLARLVRDGLRYLDSLSKEADSPGLGREIVNAYVRMSQVQGDSYHGNLGDTKGALESARKAVAEAQRLLRADQSPAALSSAAAAFAIEGTLLYASGDLHSAEGLLRKATDLGEEAVREQPSHPENSIALARNLRALGDLYGGIGMQNLGDTSRAVAYYRRAADITGQLTARFPRDLDAQKAQYHAVLSLAGIEKSVGLLSDSTADLRRVVGLIGTVIERHPDDAPAQVEMANASVQLGQSLLDARQPREAMPYIAHSAETLEKLSALDPKNAFYRRSLSQVENQYAAALRGSGDLPGALTQNRKALALSEALSAESPGSVEFKTDVGVNRRKLADTMLAAGDDRGALEQAGQATAGLCGVAEASGDAYIKANCGRALVTAGNAQSGLERPVPALRSYGRAEAIARALCQADPANAISRSDLARTESAFARGLVGVQHRGEAREMYRRALDDWAILRKSKALTGDDNHRAEDAERALAVLSQK